MLIFAALSKAATEAFLWAALVVAFIAGILKKRR
jgi:hypothetical protein